MRRRNAEKEQAEDKVLDVNASMQGTLRFDDPVNLRINGKFEGMLDTKGKLMVGDNADIRANITGEEISVAGNVSGNIKAAMVLRLDSSAVLNGDVETPRISIQEGAVLNGNLRMTQDQSSAGPARGNWLTITQLAKYLEVDADKVDRWVSDGKLPGSREGGEWIFEKTKVDQWIADGKVAS